MWRPSRCGGCEGKALYGSASVIVYFGWRPDQRSRLQPAFMLGIPSSVENWDVFAL